MVLTTTDWFTLALVVITAFYAWATFRILRVNEAVVAAMKEQTDSQLRAYVLVSMAPRIGTTLLCLTIKNVGRSPALNLRLTLDRDFFRNGERREDGNLAKLSAFSEPMDSLPPNAEMIFILGMGAAIVNSQASDPSTSPLTFRVNATYDFGSRHFVEDTPIDLRPHLSSTVPHDPIAVEIERLRKSVDDLAAKVERAWTRLS